MTKLGALLAAAALAALGTQSAFALPLAPSSYDTANGNGTASGGSFNYWDLEYSGAGATSTDGAPLTGGLGNLTDGVVAALNWSATENGGGTGPYVGWCRLCGAAPVADPTITFRFTPGALETYVFDTVTLYLDDSNGSGGVQPPSAIGVKIGADPAFSTPVADPSSGDPFSVTIDLGGTIGEQIAIQLFHNNQWVFLSEVSFEGRIIIRDDFGDVQAPATLALLGAGLVGLGALGRHYRRS